MRPSIDSLHSAYCAQSRRQATCKLSADSWRILVVLGGKVDLKTPEMDLQRSIFKINRYANT